MTREQIISGFLVGAQAYLARVNPVQFAKDVFGHEPNDYTNTIFKESRTCFLAMYNKLPPIYRRKLVLAVGKFQERQKGQ